MKNRRLFVFAALLLTLCLLCTACGGETEEVLPEESAQEAQTGLSEDTVNDFSMYEGIWLGEAENEYDSIEFDAEGNWKLYLGGDVTDEGYLRYEPEWDAVYAYSSLDDSGSRAELEDGRLYLTSYGYFNFGDGMEYYWYEDGGGDHDGGGLQDDEPYTDNDNTADWDNGSAEETDAYYDWNSELSQHDVSGFEGVWYFDGDLSAETYLVIDGSGNWSYYQRAPGAEAAEMDCGTLSYSTDEVSTYYADSTMYDGVSIRVFEFDTGVIVWGDEGVYYLSE